MIRLVLYISLFYALILYIIFNNKGYSVWNKNFINKVELYKRAIEHSPEFYAVNNLNFVPARDYKGKPIPHYGTFVNYYNNAGYRGDIVPIEKNNEKVRILFLGGSTTVQEGGTTIESTYPELVRFSLIHEFHFNSNKLEIINAGLDGANSFDILNAYLYKYKYYQPDFLIIHSGFNDCSWYIDSLAYSPDYTHLNMSISVDEVNKPILVALSFLMKFKPTAWLVINYIEKVHYSGIRRLEKAKKLRNHFPDWLRISPDSALKSSTFNAFYNNIKTLAQNAHINQTKIILMQTPFPIGNDYYNGIFGKAIRQHNNFLQEISQELNIPLVKLSDINMPDSCYKDVIHVDSIGNYLKAKAVSKKIVEIVQQ